jgi:hypothetical protein
MRYNTYFKDMATRLAAIAAGAAFAIYIITMGSCAALGGLFGKSSTPDKPAVYDSAIGLIKRLNDMTPKFVQAATRHCQAEAQVCGIKGDRECQNLQGCHVFRERVAQTIALALETLSRAAKVAALPGGEEIAKQLLSEAAPALEWLEQLIEQLNASPTALDRLEAELKKSSV